MPSSEEVLELLSRYAARERNADIRFAAFAAFAGEDAGGPEGAAAALAAPLRQLAQANHCRLELQNGEIRRILFARPILEIIQKAWGELESRPELPFPAEESLKLNVPAELLQVVDIKTGFVQALGRPESGAPLAIRIVFPESLGSIIITSDLLPRKLLELSIHKLRLYLDVPATATYMFHKLRTIFPHRDLVLKDMFGQLASRPVQAVASLVEASDFSFRFWAHLASVVIQEFRAKDHKLPDEIGCSQAAYLVGFYTVYFKGIVQKEKSSQNALRNLEVYLRKPPYVFTITDIFGFRDSKEVPLIQKYSQELLLQYLKEKTTPGPNQAIPEIVRVRTADNREYYLHRDVLLPLCLKKVYEASRMLKEEIVDEWAAELRRFRQIAAMREDEAFLAELKERLKSVDPVLHALLRYDLLFFTRREAKVRPEVAEEIGRFLDPKRRALLPLAAILGLRRRELLSRARLRLPVWMTIPVLRELLALVKRLFEKRERRSVPAKGKHPAPRRAATPAAPPPADRRAGAPPAAAAAEATAQPARHSSGHRRELAALRQSFVEDGSSIEDSLRSLAEKWNPLLEQKAKQQLVEDVNALIRDYLRALKRAFQVRLPDVARIRSLAQTLSENRAFREIRNKELLRRYIEIYMVKLLGER